MRKNWTPYAWKLLWTVGLIVLLMISYNLELKVKNHVATTFHMLPIIWFQFIANFLLGIYLSILFIKEWSVKWNWPLLVCVTLPFLFFACYYPMVISIIENTTSDPNNYSVPFLYPMLQLSFNGIPAIIAGLTLMIGLFSTSPKVINNL
ncbi:hypothetical protein [Psychrobacillus lasiicapitis]|uniref:Uncharacterized protein n=1 Tax=Psychrobacillus lasiicapitis TaxID=1636719 RepID=A0A544SY94_9BACI|nr:hypothetical protein [Psychrobacillus lasiicapitis]TQR10182.1 hypothetical protein FG382_17605 [Psychrobacillus lasiicapitis]GGA46093.1 hypothetical protein GCM10011384_39740 [Psychrobacillus lasiicapitis]